MILDELNEILESQMTRRRIPGAAVAVLYEGKVYGTAAGVLSSTSSTKCTPATLFPIGCLTKIFTATLAFLLQRHGLQFDASIDTYQFDFQDEEFGSPTIRQLLSHSSGLDGDPLLESAPGGIGRFNVYASDTVSRPRLFPCGSMFSYSDTGALLTAAIMEKFLNCEWHDLIEEQILSPLGLRMSWNGDRTYQTASEHYLDHRDASANAVPRSFYYPIGQEPAGTGNVSMSVLDIIKFAALHMPGQRRRPDVDFALMREPNISVDLYPYRGWGSGWALLNGDAVGVFGRNWGSQATLCLVPSRQLAVAVAANARWSGSPFAFVCSDIITKMANIEICRDQPPSAIKVNQLAQYTGKFGRTAGTFDIREKGSTLLGSYENNTGAGRRRSLTEFTLTPKGNDTFDLFEEAPAPFLRPLKFIRTGNESVPTHLRSGWHVNRRLS